MLVSQTSIHLYSFLLFLLVAKSSLSTWARQYEVIEFGSERGESRVKCVTMEQPKEVKGRS